MWQSRSVSEALTEPPSASEPASPRAFPQTDWRLSQPEQTVHWEGFFGPPPDSWIGWTQQAEAKLLEATETDPKGNQGRGTLLKVCRQRISRPQAGPHGLGVNVTMQRLRLRIAQFD